MSGTREPTHAGSWYTSHGKFSSPPHLSSTPPTFHTLLPTLSSLTTLTTLHTHPLTPPRSRSRRAYLIASANLSHFTGSSLKTELSQNLSKVTPLPELQYTPPVLDAKAIIAPHAGYSYSGPTAAWAYAAIPSSKVKRVFLLGPSHHAYINGLALSPFAAYGTPLGDLPLCLDTIDELRKSGLFKEAAPNVDEDEHSLEMHLPYLRLIFDSRPDLRLVPIIVGQPNLHTDQGLNVVKILAKYFEDESTFFVISSDFCHWGSRFSCTPYYPDAPDPANPVPPVPSSTTLPAHTAPPELVKRFASPGSVPIWKSIQYMDHEGMDLLRYPAGTGALEKWEAYLDRTKNTICGRNPISVLLAIIAHVNGKTQRATEKQPHFVFVRYEQSSKCVSGRDSSVSYAWVRTIYFKNIAGKS